MSTAAYLTELLVPYSVVGLSIGDPKDRATWRIDYSEKAIDEDKKIAQSFIDEIDYIALEKTLDSLAILDTQISHRLIGELSDTSNPDVQKAAQAIIADINSQKIALRESLPAIT